PRLFPRTTAPRDSSDLGSLAGPPTRGSEPCAPTVEQPPRRRQHRRGHFPAAQDGIHHDPGYVRLAGDPVVSDAVGTEALLEPDTRRRDKLRSHGLYLNLSLDSVKPQATLAHPHFRGGGGRARRKLNGGSR